MTSPRLVATAQMSWPADTPSAVETPLARPPRKVLRMVKAVSGPGATITTIETPRNVRNEPSISVSDYLRGNCSRSG